MKRSRKRMVRYGLFAANFALVAGVVTFMVKAPAAGSANKQAALAITNKEDVASPLDQLSSADIAAHVANLANLAEANSVSTNADTVNAQLSISPVDDKVIAKTQVADTAIKSRRDIKNYTAQAGDTISSIAEKFGVTSNSIRWSNSLYGNAVDEGEKLVIPPINGMVYTVKSGDTPESLANKYSSNKQAIIEFNDAEVGGLVEGEQIVIPDGVRPAPSRPSVGTGFAWGGYNPIYGVNGYDYGYCTWWVAVRRQQIGRPIPSNLGNASTWKLLAQRSGLSVGTTPQTGAVIWTPPRDYYGHVAFVEKVNEDGTVSISEMNVVGWNVVNYDTLSPSEAANYYYIY